MQPALQSVPSSDDDDEHDEEQDEMGDHHHHHHDHHSPSQSQHQPLVLWQGIVLLTAECVGVGILALPNNVHTLGRATTTQNKNDDTDTTWLWGLGFLILNLPINFVAGTYLSRMAMELDRRCPNVHQRITATITTTTSTVLGNDDDDDRFEDEINNEHDGEEGGNNNNDDDNVFQMRAQRKDDDDNEIELSGTRHHPLTATSAVTSSTTTTTTTTGTILHHRFKEDPRIESPWIRDDSVDDEHDDDDDNCRIDQQNDGRNLTYGSILGQTDRSTTFESDPNHTTTTTLDLITLSRVVFHSHHAHRVVIGLYYLNLFLVLGDYILVMGRAMAAVTLDSLCIPVAGALASILMFGICQFRTMALLGRKVSLASLLAMLIVLLQCLFHHRSRNGGAQTTIVGNGESTTIGGSEGEDEKEDEAGTTTTISIWSKFSALAGIFFAVGSQKLLLNVRHELLHKEDLPKVLAGGLTTYGLAYVGVVLMAGSNPPSFLFDAIPEGGSRQVAGLLLWGHLAVSYAINSQALCSSMDRFLVVSDKWRLMEEEKRWFCLTLTVVISSYLVSNAVPFFKDLVALIGALTSVPLTLTLPALLYRKFHRLPLFLPEWRRMPRSESNKIPTCGSYPMLLYSLVFIVIGWVGALWSIDEDWLNQGRPFACHQ